MAVNRWFEFTPSQVKCIVTLSFVLLMLGGFQFVRDYARSGQESIRTEIRTGGSDSSYEPVFRVDLNTSPPDSLELLPYVGPVLVSRIIAFRDSAGFERPEDIIKVRGIGRRTYERIKSFIEVKP
jgi:DNA uptake protein ComE-like DNA-binding protein